MRALSIIIALLLTAVTQAGYPAGTLVTMENGETKPIEQIQLGDKVYSPLEKNPVTEVQRGDDIYTPPASQTAGKVTKVTHEVYSGVVVVLTSQVNLKNDEFSVMTTDYKPLLYTASWGEAEPPSLEYKRREPVGPFASRPGYVLNAGFPIEGLDHYCTVMVEPIEGMHIYGIEEREVWGMAVYSFEVEHRQKSYSVNGFTAVY